MAQVGHGTMLLATFLELPVLTRWSEAGLPVAVRQASPEQWTDLTEASGQGLGTRRVAVRDAGFTEVDPGTVTVVADGAPLR
jgi:peptidyl-tRNA hydrolase